VFPVDGGHHHRLPVFEEKGELVGSLQVGFVVLGDFRAARRCSTRGEASLRRVVRSMLDRGKCRSAQRLARATGKAGALPG
jgi:hypothetical protein